MLAHVQVMTPEEQQAMMAADRRPAPRRSRRRRGRSRRRAGAGRGAGPGHGRRRGRTGARAGVDPADPGTWGASGRNDPCPCGSGKKYKHCHGKV